jgi:hypothetical protein
MTQPRSAERRSDPWSILTAGLRQVSRLDLDDLRRGLENFAHPSAAGLMDSLGRTRQERVEKMAELLRNSSEADIEEMGTIFGLAMAKLAEERAAGGDPATPAVGNTEDDELRNRPRRRRGQSAAEWRRERRLAS